MESFTANNVQLTILDLPNEILIDIVAYLDSVSTRKFAITCTHAIDILFVVYPFVCTQKEYEEYGIAGLLRLLVLYSCGFCDKIVLGCACKAIANAQYFPHNRKYECAECRYSGHVDMFKPIMLQGRYSNFRKELLICRFGCNWYCGYCDRVFKRSQGIGVESEGWIVCDMCICTREFKKNYVNIHDPMILDCNRFTQIKQIDDVAHEYPPTKEVIERYQPSLQNTVIMKYYYNNLYKRYDIIRSHIADTRSAFLQHYVYTYGPSDDLLWSIRGLFGDSSAAFG
jgi:hypothetical protein